MDKNEIYQIYGTNYKENTITLLREANLHSLIPAKDARIAIKPNLVSASDASYGATTHPEIVEGIIDYLKEHGFSNIVIMEGSWVGADTAESFDICGYTALSRKTGVPLIDLQKADSVRKDCAGMELAICKPALEADFIINVPVLKGHCQTRITCALKNMKGVIPNPEKRRFHSMGLHKPIAHLSTGIKQHFIVVDHICGDLDFEDGGNPVVRNGIFVGRDPVLMDALVCHMLHYETEDVPYILMAQSLGIGSADLEHAKIRVIQTSSTFAQENSQVSLNGQDKSQAIPDSLPIPGKAVLVEDAVEEVESCSACYGYLIPALSRLHEEGLFPFTKEKICIGQGFRGKCGKIGIGDCTAGFDFNIAGCPPTENQIYEGLKAYIEKFNRE